MPQNKKPAAEQIQHYNAVLIEELTSNFKFVIERMESLDASLRAEMDRRFNQVDARFDIIEKVLAYHSQKFAENDKRWEENDKRWEENDKRWEENDKCWEENGKRLQAIESQLLRIESILVFQNQRLHSHDLELARLMGK